MSFLRKVTLPKGLLTRNPAPDSTPEAGGLYLTMCQRTRPRCARSRALTMCLSMTACSAPARDVPDQRMQRQRRRAQVPQVRGRLYFRV